MSLSKSEIERYQRQLQIENWDQERLKKARVLIVGIGGLGGVSATYLAAAGVGHLRICDCDKVEISNLNRQIIFASSDINNPKTESAVKRLLALNPEIKIETIFEKIASSNARELASGCDLIIDGLDNHADRLILNQASFDLGIPYIYAAVNEWQGQLSFFAPPKTACLACLLPDVRPNPQPTPVFGALPGTIGSLQATLALRYLMTGEFLLSNALLIYHGDTMIFETVTFEKRLSCTVCGQGSDSIK